MMLYCGLLLLFFNCVRTTENVYPDSVLNDRVAEFNKRFSWWPSVHNAARLMKMKRNAMQDANSQVPIVSEGGGLNKLNSSSLPEPPVAAEHNGTKMEKQDNTTITTTATVKVPTITEHANATASNSTETKGNSTVEMPRIDLNNPGVLKRGFIVFGGFSLLAIAYFIFYRRKSKKNDTSNGLSSNESNQFRYGVLQSEDRRDNLELSHVPLTMESDDDEEEDLEIFDLEQKKKSLSYVNLQTNDEDIVFPHKESKDNDRENLLLDIDDGTSETLINWSSNGSKSIL